jgi:LPS export ABC transporter protein LptC
MAGVFRHSRTVSWAFGPAGVLTLVLGLALPGPLAVAYADDVRAPVVELTGMTFLATSGSRTQLRLEAETAEIPGGSDIAYLKGVRGHVAGDRDSEGGLDMSCDRAEYHLDTNDFVAEGTVRGKTGDGRRFQTARLRYDHEQALAVSDVAVTIWDRHGRYRGGGFRYHVGQGRFQLLDGASVTQE